MKGLAEFFKKRKNGEGREGREVGTAAGTRPKRSTNLAGFSSHHHDCRDYHGDQRSRAGGCVEGGGKSSLDGDYYRYKRTTVRNHLSPHRNEGGGEGGGGRRRSAEMWSSSSSPSPSIHCIEPSLYSSNSSSSSKTTSSGDDEFSSSLSSRGGSRGGPNNSNNWNPRRRRKKKTMKTMKQSGIKERKHHHRQQQGSCDHTATYHYHQNEEEEYLTREELFELPAKKLRKKCKKLGLDTSNITEKEELVLLIHEYYRSYSSTTYQHQNNVTNHTMRSANSSSASSALTTTRTNLGVQSSSSSKLLATTIKSNNITLPNDENEQMIEVLFEILPYYGQGDVSIDNIVKDTIQRLPFYCLESRDKLTGNTLLMLSCQIGAVDLVTMLVAKGADVNIQNGNGETCLHFACYNDSYSPDIAKILVNNGARAEMPERKFGCTPLHWAASLGDIELCSLLCYAGANTKTVDKSGFDPISYAKQGQKKDCVKYLQSQPVGTEHERKSEDDSSYNQPMSKGVEDEHGFEKLVDHNTGYAYFHNWQTGESLWEEDYILFKQSLAKGGLRPIASSFSNRPPPPSHGTSNSSKSFLGQETLKEGHQIDFDSSVLDATAQGKDSTIIQRLDSLDFSDNIKDEGSKKDFNVGIDSKSYQNHSHSLSNIIGHMDAKIVLSDTDESSTEISMIEIGAEEKNNIKIWNGKGVIDKPLDNVKNIKSSQRDLNEDIQHDPINKPLNNEKNINFSQRDQNEIQDVNKYTSDKLLVTQDSFNTRLSSMQSRMEEQLNNQLKKMEDKISRQPTTDMVDQSKSYQLQDSVSQLNTRVVELQANLSAKEFEIVSLKHKIISLEKDADNSVSRKEKVDAMVGSQDVRDEHWVKSSDVDKLSKENAMMESQILELKECTLNLQMKGKIDERELKNLTENQERGKAQVLQLEALLKQERNAKNEVIGLLEQAQRGMQVDSEVARSLQDDKRRSDEELKNVQNQLKMLKIKQSDDEAIHGKAIEESERQILVAHEKIKSLGDEIEKEKVRHKFEHDEIVRKHMKEINEVNEILQIKFKNESEVLEKRLQEEKLSRMQNEVERNNAVKAYENAIKQTKKAEDDMKRMSAMIEEAKALIGKNEKLHRSLNDEIEKRKALHNHLEDLRGKIRVYVRIRPLDANELAKKCKEALYKEDKRTCVLNQTSRNDCKSWEFDQIFHGYAQNGNSQEDVFKDTKRLVTSVIDGFNVCIFAYGQTGSGKTYTMFGPGGEIPSGVNSSMSLNEDLGLAPRVACELFRLVEERQTSFDISVHMNMFELYNDNLRDLLVQESQERTKNSTPLKIKLAEHSQSGLVEVSGAQTELVESAAKLLDFFRRGSEIRTTACTKMNADSSRSHLITSITVSLKNKRTENVTHGKMTLVDLAGSERVGKSGATGNQLREAQSINKSLSALGDVINALTSGSKHVPYRNHPLTMLMSDSMGGNAKTLMFVCCSPADYNSAESGNALDFAKRCKDVTNNVVGGIGGRDSGQVKALKAELSRLKREKGSNIRRKNGVAKRPGLKD